MQPDLWYVMTTVAWTVGGDTQGGTLLGTADVGDGEEAELVLTP